ncbi:MAG TPA: sulfatase [Gemmataceae bacterium]|nr:sulfatase [Gemmataceae bacterium]
MRTASLLGVLLLAKLLMLAGRGVPLSFWTPFAYIWQDLLVVLLFALLDTLTRWRWSWVGWTVYGALVLYAAVNVPVARVLSTPLTWPMIRAAGAPLGDSIAHYATALYVGLLLLVVAAGVGFPWLFRHVQPQPIAIGAVVALPVIVVGVVGEAQVETLGLHRNAVVAVVASLFPRVATESDPAPQPEPLNAPTRAEDLARYRGAAAGRNVLLVILESAAAQYLRPYGAAEDVMPNLTELADRGILFENAYTVYPESIKSLFALLYARYPAMDTEPEQYEAIKTPALAAVLQRQGYHTALFHSGRFRYLGMESIIRNRGYEVLEDAGDIGGNRESSFGVDEPSTVRRLLGWLDGLPRGQRFFATYIPVAGHHPYETPERGPFPCNEEIDRYRNAQHYADASLGTLLRGLQERGLERDTLVVVIGDHGEAFGQHPGNFGHMLFTYEENVHVPFLVAAAGAIDGPVRVKRVASEVDLGPTVLDLLGLPAPEDYQGRSLLGERDETALFFTDYSLGLLGLRDGNWKFCYDVLAGRSKLYDLQADPEEQRSVAEQHPERVERYRKYLLRWAAVQRSLVIQPR